MSNIQPSNEHIKNVTQRYLSDKYIQACYKEMSDIEERSIPKYIIRDTQIIKRIFDADVEKALGFISALLSDYIRAQYPELINYQP